VYRNLVNQLEGSMNRVLRILVPALAAACLSSSTVGLAASHREAPQMANDPTADITDVYFFRSWEDTDKLILIMNVIPGQDPGSGPNYFNFADDVRYAFHLDIDGDGKADDITYEIRFSTELRGNLSSLKLPLSYVALPPITALQGAGSDGLILRQTYTVTEVRNGKRESLSDDRRLVAVPSNVGPLTIPNYEDLAQQGVYNLEHGIRVFAGQRDETFYIDLGAVFDTVNLRRQPVPLLTAAEDADDFHQPFGVDHFSGLNVSTIALEIPISRITHNKKAVLGLYASTSRQSLTVQTRKGQPESDGPWVQVSRMANPLVNELIIGTEQKDLWNASEPEDEANFLDFYLNSRLATALNLRFSLTGTPLELPASNRKDLVNALLKYPNQTQNGQCSRKNRCAELLRLDLSVDPTQPNSQRRLGPLAHDAGGTPTPDPAGWPNGRRPNDDVTDIALRVVAGILVKPQPKSGALLLGDGVNFNIGATSSNVTANGIYTKFPFLPTPHDGRNRRHIDCGEVDANPC